MKKHSKTEPAVNPCLKSGSAKKAKTANAMEPSEVVAELVRKLSQKVHAEEAAAAGSLLQKVAEPAGGVGVGKTAGSRQGRQPLGMNLDRLTIGLDLGDRMSNYCMVATDGEVLLEGKVKTEREAMRKLFEALSGSRVVVEVGTHSAWVEEVLKEIGHEVVVANARKMEGNKKKRKKNDKEDARMLARKGRADPESLYPIEQRGGETRQGLTLVRLRGAVVEVRTKLINALRGTVKSYGERLGKCSSESFAERAAEEMPEQLQELTEPVVELLGMLNETIAKYDAGVEKLAEEKYGVETGRMRQIGGVGALTSLVYVLTIGDPARFRKSREVGPYLGVVPRQEESGESAPQLRITKAGDEDLRCLLVGSAHYILGPFGKDSDLRRYGLALSERGGKNGKKRAVVAVARRLAVLLHRLWVSGEKYEPLRNARLKEEGEKIAAEKESRKEGVAAGEQAA